MRKAVFRWKVMIDRPTRSGWRSRTSCSRVERTSRCTSTRSATATRWWASRLPASELRAPFGMRMPTVGMCSNESGIDARRMFIWCLHDLTDHEPETRTLLRSRSDHEALDGPAEGPVEIPEPAAGETDPGRLRDRNGVETHPLAHERPV